MTFHFELTENEINLVLTALAQLPYAQVAAMIEKLHQQAKQQQEQNHGQ
jgi:hypothetical protein